MTELDGRVARSIRSRVVVAEAWAARVEAEPMPPDMETLAEESGVSVRSIYRLFGDNRAVVDEGVVARLRAVRPLVAVDAPARASLANRCEAVAVGHGALHEALLNFRFFAIDPTAAPVVTKALGSLRRARRAALSSIFERELDRLGSDDRPARLDAIESASGWGTWHGLRVDQRLARTRAQDIVEAELRAILR